MRNQLILCAALGLAQAVELTRSPWRPQIVKCDFGRNEVEPSFPSLPDFDDDAFELSEEGAEESDAGQNLAQVEASKWKFPRWKPKPTTVKPTTTIKTWKPPTIKPIGKLPKLPALPTFKPKPITTIKRPTTTLKPIKFPTFPTSTRSTLFTKKIPDSLPTPSRDVPRFKRSRVTGQPVGAD